MKGRINKVAERAKQHYNVLVKPDGEEVFYSPQDFLKAFSAAVAKPRAGDHWLLKHAMEAGEGEYLHDLARTIEESRRRTGEEGDAE